MRVISNILFALGRLPGLGFFTGIAQSIYEAQGVSEAVKSAKKSKKD